VLFDAENPFGENLELSQIIHREPLSAIKRADAVLLTRSRDLNIKKVLLKALETWRIPYWKVPFTNLIPVSINQQPFRKELKVGLITAIARPKKLISDLSFSVHKSLIKPDHSCFSKEEVQNFSKTVDSIVTTEKDYWRDPKIFYKLKTPVFLLPIAPEIPKDFLEKYL
jgi:tetraacyldisaccharide 4'-kinase